MKGHILLLSFLLYSSILLSQCFPDRHSTSWNDAWISCETSQNPNALRGETHWIRYDLNHTYALGEVTVWNFNDPKNLGQGIKDVVIDYSLDGESWIEWGTYTLEQASGSAFYEGHTGLDLDGLHAKEILITAINNYGEDCFALGEIKIEVEEFVSDVLEEELALNLKLSPVPASDILTVDMDAQNITGKMHYSIYSMDGKSVYVGSLEKTGTKHIEKLNVSNLNSGQYILEFLHEEAKKSISFSIIK